MESVDELGLVIGGTDNTLLYGDDVNLNHVLDPEETSTAGGLGNGQFTAGLLEYCTVYSREANTMSDGTKRTLVTNRQAVVRMLNTVLGSGRGTAIQNTVIQALERVDGLRITGEPPNEVFPWVTNTLELYALSGLSVSDFETIAPYLANAAGDYTSGLINVNTASETVLACVPGIGDSFAQALVAARAQRGTSPDQADWSWVVTIVGARNCRTAGVWLTTRSYQVSADIAAVGRYGRGYRRTRFVIDTSTGTPQIVYRRELGYLGWALGQNERVNLRNNLALTQGGVAR
jgi:DNA uptake protein ComE-like DNA-binding protein